MDQSIANAKERGRTVLFIRADGLKVVAVCGNERRLLRV